MNSQFLELVKEAAAEKVLGFLKEARAISQLAEVIPKNVTREIGNPWKDYFTKLFSKKNPLKPEDLVNKLREVHPTEYRPKMSDAWATPRQ